MLGGLPIGEIMWLAAVYSNRLVAIADAIAADTNCVSASGKSLTLAIACAIAALCLAIFAEWSHAPFRKPNDSLFYFVTHLHQLDGFSVKFIMMGLGVGCAYWFAKGR